jgi:hypothetical protein
VQGVDTSDCFERGDLEVKWNKLTDAQRAAADEVRQHSANGERAPGRPS